MKADSCGLECIFEIDESELKALFHGGLDGILIFREVGGDGRREIPFSLKYNKKQKEDIEFSTNLPKTYFGDAESIEFVIGYYFYECLKEKRQYGNRFATGGKLDIRVSS